jgi:CDP-diacylglycerol--serine O-phosphatidyltransferase
LLAGFLFTACGAARLARFNVLASLPDAAKPSGLMLGLPIPGAAGVIVSFFVVHHSLEDGLTVDAWSGPLLVVTAILSLLMISTIRFRSLKTVKFNARTVAAGAAITLALGALVYAGMRPAMLFAWIFLAYVVFGLFEAIRRTPAKSSSLQDPARPPKL